MQRQRRGRVLRILDGLPAVVLLAQRERARPRRRPLAALAARRHLLRGSTWLLSTFEAPSYIKPQCGLGLDSKVKECLFAAACLLASEPYCQPHRLRTLNMYNL